MPVIRRTKVSPADPMRPHDAPPVSRVHYAAKEAAGVVVGWTDDKGKALDLSDADAARVLDRHAAKAAPGRLELLDPAGKVLRAAGTDAAPLPPKPAGESPEVKKLRKGLAAAEEQLLAQQLAAEETEAKLMQEIQALRAENERLKKDAPPPAAPKGGTGTAPPK